MSFLFIESSTDRLIGHARICLLPNRPTACWIESVIVEKNCRGHGLGKLLMSSLEDVAKKFGFDEVAYLCTDDQVVFYERCGYKKCDPILHSTTATSVFPISNLKDPQSKAEKPTQRCDSKKAVQHTKSPSSTQAKMPLTISNSPAGASLPVAPPPPPAPPKKVPMAPVSTVDHQYMWKKLI
ncbi:N-acetyltransferase 6 [Trichostrongylus colubriformis]|uniref:N-acetyltransferase 6 n=1 Tax=Trichostrongylus colubriformis TaxID=6319 RepID=A0AAN8FE47_TRICO